MEKPKTEQTRLSIIVDKKHNTVYCIEPNGRSYIKKTNENHRGGEAKCCSSKV